MKAFYITILLALWSACQPGGSKESSSIPTSISSIDPCSLHNQALNGAFSTKYMEGTMTWSGGTEGRVEISGVDYNDITCMYIIPDCAGEIISMNCDGGVYDTE